LTVVGSDGGEPRALKANELMAYYPKPAWSPDGRRIAFVDQEGDGFCDDAGTECPPSQLFTIALDGGTVSSVGRLDKRNEFSPAWSPDGKLLAFDNALDIAVMRADGRGRTSLLGAAAAGGTDLAPDWQPRCTLYGTARSERLVGSAGRDVICALGGDDTIDARGGDDVVIGGDGDDRIDGGPGEDRLFGAFGADAIESRDGAVDIVDGGPGTDTATVDPVDAERLVP
jgi:Ca2+-binding RTX toxin-like protein